MDKRFSWIFLLASGAFFVFIVGLTGYRIEDTRRHNALSAREHAASLAAKVRSLRDTTGGYEAPLFKANMRAVFDSEPRLLLLSLHSPQDGMVYLVSRNRSILKEPSPITSGWRGTPVYQENKGYETLIGMSIENDARGVTMDTLFVIMGREDLYPVVRDDLYLFLAFLLVCGVAILIVMSVQEDAASSQRAAPGRKTTAGPTPASAPGPVPRPGAQPVMQSAPNADAPAREPEEPGRAFMSPRSGLVWGEYLQPRLEAELERAASADLDISLAHLRIDEPFADSRLPLAYIEIARMLKESFPLHDLIFETANDSYTVLLPDADVDAAVRQLDQFRRKLEATTIEGKNRTLSIGVSSRGGRLIDDHVLREEADIAVAKASREGGNQVIGFRADAARFRDALSGRPA